MKDEEIIELEALREELGRCHREMRVIELQAVALMQTPATPDTRARARYIQRVISEREARFDRIAEMVLELLSRPYDDARLAAEGLPS